VWHRVLTDDTPRRLEMAILKLELAQIRQTRVLIFIVVVLALLVAGLFFR
jgi:hypothetical protein